MIDPEGVLGSVEYELMPFMVNNLPQKAIEQTIEHRSNEFAKHFGIEKDVLLKWGLCFSLLSAWWNIEDGLGIEQRDLDLIEKFNSLTSSRTDPLLRIPTEVSLIIGTNLGLCRNVLARNYGINGSPLPVVPPFRYPHLFRSSLRRQARLRRRVPS